MQDLGITVQNIARSIVEWSSSLKEEMQFPVDENASRTQIH
jgi:1-deoxy-D-xylulose-5-phosphate synthase